MRRHLGLTQSDSEILSWPSLVISAYHFTALRHTSVTARRAAVDIIAEVTEELKKMMREEKHEQESEQE